jgi:hypothetical protein
MQRPLFAAYAKTHFVHSLCQDPLFTAYAKTQCSQPMQAALSEEACAQAQHVLKPFTSIMLTHLRGSDKGTCSLVHIHTHVRTHTYTHAHTFKRRQEPLPRTLMASTSWSPATTTSLCTGTHSLKAKFVRDSLQQRDCCRSITKASADACNHVY